MEKIVYSGVNEVIYKETMANGLTVILLPKEDFNKTYGLFTTDYGSIDNHFIPLGETAPVLVPDGIAHFLEHKMFEKEAGDVFQNFGAQGASANAYTSFTKTSYLFSTTSKVSENITTLLDFVQDPYFTEETVEKEKGIIGQEIQMYQDDSNWRLFFGIIGNMYPNHPLHIDIAGTIESIAEITAEDLHLCYRTFYHPSNMNLLVVGKMNPEDMMTLIRDNQDKKEFKSAEPIKRLSPAGDQNHLIKTSHITMPVNRSKVIVGVRGNDVLPENGMELLRYQTTTGLLFQLLFGDTSITRERLYNDGLIDDSFGYDFTLDRGFHFADFGGDSAKPEELAAEIKSILLNAATSPDLTDEKLTLLKKKMLGKHLQSLNSLEFIARKFSQMSYGDATLFDMVEVIDSITLSDIHTVRESFIKEESISEFYIYPEEEN